MQNIYAAVLANLPNLRHTLLFYGLWLFSLHAPYAAEVLEGYEYLNLKTLPAIPCCHPSGGWDPEIYTRFPPSRE